MDDGLREVIEQATKRAEGRVTLHGKVDYIERAVRAWAVGELEARTTTLRDENERLRAALDEIDHHTYGWSYDMAFTVITRIRLTARAALGSGDPERNEGGK